ncbi:MAG: FprA family A-type flavoprotein, partial [Armatimonadota bacterium]
ATPLTDRVFWVGAIDWGVRDFHGYLTSRGSTYNAYLILADKVTLIDTVKAPFKREMLQRIASVVDPRRIDYIISNHTEMDHSGSLPEVIAAANPERVFASTRGVEALGRHFRIERDIEAVKEGDSLSLGNATLAFVETPMLHWPDSMFTYLAEERILFSSDAFGMHLAASERFADEIAPAILKDEAAKYYANILLPLSPLVGKLLDKVTKLNLPIDVIAPSHGPIWRKNIAEMLGYYASWAQGQRRNRAVVAYDTMWGSTDLMARAVGDGLATAGTSVKLMPLRSCHRSDVATELLDAGALIVGSPCLNGGIFPTVADVLTYLRGLKPRNLVGAAFGSYGWSGEAVGQITDALREMKVDVVAEGVRIKYVPDAEALMQCFELGAVVAEKLKGLPAPD